MRGAARGEFQGPGEGGAEGHSPEAQALGPYDAERDFGESIASAWRVQARWKQDA